jgi:ribosomal protein L3 glutamine methyltransferase
MIAEKRSAIVDTLATIGDYIRWGASRFTEAGVCFGHGTATAIDEAAALVLHTLHQPHELPSVYFSAVLTPAERGRVVDLIERRIGERKPLAYLLGEAWFGGLPFYVDERVLVPRSPIAELIASRFVPWVEPDEVRAILDLCTGSGCIAIACAHAFPDALVHAVDLSADALAVARENLRRHDLQDEIVLIESDLFADLGDVSYDVIVSNPPYVSRAEWEGLPEEYRAEPRLGLEAGDDGLDCVRRILRDARHSLRPDGVLVVEVGSAAEALMETFPTIPFRWLEFEHGGEGVFLLTAAQLAQYQNVFEAAVAGPHLPPQKV